MKLTIILTRTVNGKELRKKKNVGQGDAAKALNVTRQAINQYETGKRVPTPEIWDKLADYFDVSIEQSKKEEVLSLLFVCPEYMTDIYLLLNILSIA